MSRLSKLPEYPRAIAEYLFEFEGYEENEAAAVAINHTRRAALNPTFGDAETQVKIQEAVRVFEADVSLPVQMSSWTEADHPRAVDGKFTSGAGVAKQLGKKAGGGGWEGALAEARKRDRARAAAAGVPVKTPSGRKSTWAQGGKKKAKSAPATKTAASVAEPKKPALSIGAPVGTAAAKPATKKPAKTAIGLAQFTDDSIPEFDSNTALNDFLKKRYPAKNFDIEAAPEYRRLIAQQVDALAKAYPRTWDKAIKKVGNDRLLNKLLGDSVYATYSPQTKQMYLNPEFFNNPTRLEASLKNSVKTGWTPKGNDSMESIITHEFGHAYDEMRKRIMKVESPGEYKTLEDAQTHNFKVVGGNIHSEKKSPNSEDAPSLYATTSPEEYFAEAFAEAHHGLSPSAYTKRLKKVLGKLDLSGKRLRYGGIAITGG